MGDKCVITTRENYDNNGVGVYLHWNGGRDSVEAFLKYMELRGFRSPTHDCYGWARLCQVIGNYFGGGLSIGIDQVNNLDTEGDNGTYIIDGWNIVGRENFDLEERYQYDMNDMLMDIDAAQPESEQLGKEFLRTEEMPVRYINVGDQVFVMNFDGKYNLHKVVGIGGGSKLVNGRSMKGVPYVNKYDHENGDYSWNCNNYLTEQSYRVIRYMDDADYDLLF